MIDRYRRNYFNSHGRYEPGTLGMILQGILTFDRFLGCWVDNSAADYLPPVLFTPAGVQ